MWIASRDFLVEGCRMFAPGIGRKRDVVFEYRRRRYRRPLSLISGRRGFSSIMYVSNRGCTIADARSSVRPIVNRAICQPVASRTCYTINPCLISPFSDQRSSAYRAGVGTNLSNNTLDRMCLLSRRHV